MTPDDITRTLDAWVARRATAGLQYRFVQGDEVRLEHSAGWADAPGLQPVTPATTFNVYSITKVFTAAAVLTLADRGMLDLDMPIGQAAGLPDLQAFGRVRDTLLHRAGFPNPPPLRWVHAAADHAGFDEAAFVQERLAGLAGRRPLRGAGYSNLGYLALGLAVERAGGMPFTRRVQADLLAPLQAAGEPAAGFAITDPTAHARGHLRRWSVLNLLLGLLVDRGSIADAAGQGWVRLHLHQVNGSAYGGLIAHARALSRFGQMVLGQRPGLGAAVRAGLLAPVPGPGPQRSLGLYAGTLAGRRWLAHAGGGLGSYGELRLYPDEGAVSVLLLDRPGLRDARLLDRVDRAWWGGRA